MSKEFRELLLGCGHSREKRIFPYSSSNPYGWSGRLTTLDDNHSCHPDVVFDLSRIGSYAPHGEVSLPFDDDTFDEIHAYEVLEHIGAQGDFRLLFDQFAEFYRVLKPNGYFCATVPRWDSVWTWGDPGHTRVISSATLIFLDQQEYIAQIGKTSMSDYRQFLGATNFKRVEVTMSGEQMKFILEAIK